MASTDNKIVESPTTLPAWALEEAKKFWTEDGSVVTTGDVDSVEYIARILVWALSQSRRTASVGADAAAWDDWCDDCHGYTHSPNCPSRQKRPLAESLVDAVYRSMRQYEDGTWFLDNLRALARVKKLLTASPSSAAEIVGEMAREQEANEEASQELQNKRIHKASAQSLREAERRIRAASSPSKENLLSTQRDGTRSV